MRAFGVPERVRLDRVLVAGRAAGRLLVLEAPLSFWGGVDARSGEVIDVHHPQRGECIADTVLVLPATRGSTAAPGALLELLERGRGPAAIVTASPDPVALVAVLAAEFAGLQPVPVALAGQARAASTWRRGQWRLDSGRGVLERLADDD